MHLIRLFLAVFVTSLMISSIEPTRSMAAPSGGPTATTADVLSPGALRLSATYNSVGAELLFSGDDNSNATAGLEFRRTGEVDWRQGLPLWRTSDGSVSPGRAFYGSALLLDPGVTHEVRVRLADPDGTATSVVTGSVTTKPNNVPGSTTLTPAYFMSPNGNDTNSGVTVSTAWRSIDKAFASAPAGAVVQVAPGSYAPPTIARTTAISLVAQYPAVDNKRNTVNPGYHSIIEPQTYSSPQGTTGAAYVAPWRAVTLVGPATGGSYKVWKWTGSPISNASRMGFSRDRSAGPTRVAYWDRKSGTHGSYTLSTPEGWAEVLYKNDLYNYGFTSFGSDVYLRLPGDVDPNNQFIWTHNTGAQITFTGARARLSGFEVRMVDTLYDGTGAQDGVVDHNLFIGANITHRGVQSTPSGYPADHLVEYNAFLDRGAWPNDATVPGVPWLFIKGALTIDGATTPWARVGAEAERTAVNGRGGARRLVVRHNTIDGFFNGVGGYNQSFDRYSQQDTDIHDNLFRHIADDAFEPEQQAINWRVWNNRLEHVWVTLSTGPVRYGPIYFFRNQVWQMDGELSTGLGFKFSGSSTPSARIYVIHNTFWTDSLTPADGGSQSAGGGSSTERFYVRNNIFRATRYAFAPPMNTAGTSDRWNEDHNYFYTSDTSRGVKYGTNYTSVSSYRAASGQGTHSNLSDTSGSFHTEPVLTDPRNGVLTLPQGSPLIDAGTPVPNISNTFSGAAPDIGASESISGTSTIDATAPTASLTAPTSGSTVRGIANLTAEASDNQGVARVDFLANGQVVASDPSSPYSGSWDTTATADGTATVAAVAVDSAGNRATSNHAVTVDNSATVDTTAPETTIASGPAGATRSSSATFTFSSSEQGSTLQCKLDTGTFSPCTSPKQYSALTQGQHTFAVRAVDAAGNTDATPATRTWQVDTVVPSGTVIVNGGSKNTRSASVSLSLTSSDPSPGSGVDSMRFSNDGAIWSTWQSYAGTASWTLSSGSGLKTVYAQFRDRAGNVSATASDTIKLDNRKPTSTQASQSLQVNSQVAEVGTDTASGYSIPVSVRWSLYDGHSGVQSYDLQRSVDGAPYTTVKSFILQEPAIRASGSRVVHSRPGHTYQYRTLVRDAAGNSALRYGSGVRLLAYQENSRSISYVGSSQSVGSSEAYSYYLRRSMLAGTGARFSFSGSNIAWVASKAPTSGQARIYLDGKHISTPDLYSSVRAYRRLVFARNALPQTTAHTLEMRTVGTAGRPAVDLDALVVQKCITICS